MATTLLTIDESTGLQFDDTTAALPTPFQTAIGSLTPIQKAVSATGALTFSGDEIDVALTNGSGGPLSAVDSLLTTTNGTKIFLYSSTSNNNVVFGREAGAGGVADPSGAIAFAVYLDTGSGGDAGATSGTIWVALFESMHQPITTNPNDIVYLTGLLNVSVTTPIEFDATGAPSGQNLFLMIGDGTPSLTDVTVVVTADNPADQSSGASITTGGTVNTGQGGGTTTIGTNNQMVDPGEGMYFTFVKGANTDYTVPNLDQNEADVEANIAFTNLFGTTAASFGIVQLQPPKAATVKITAELASVANTNGTTQVSDDTPWSGVNYVDHLATNTTVDIISVSVTRMVKDGKTTSEHTYTFTQGGPLPTDTGGLTVDFSTDAATLTGVLQGDTIHYHTATEHDRLLIQNTASTSGSAFDIGSFVIESGAVSTSPLADIGFADDGPAAAGTAQTGVTDEDGGLTGGIAGGPGDNATATTVATGSVSAIFSGGADGVASYGLSTDPTAIAALPTLTSGGAAVAYDVTGNTLTAYVDNGAHTGYQAAEDHAVFTLGVNATTGAFTFTLLSPLDHPVTDDPSTVAVETSFEDNLALNLGAILQVTDGDGDKATAAANKLVITVNDDSPTAGGTAATGTVDEDGGLTGGNPGGPGDNATATTVATGSVAGIFAAGADGLGSYGLSTDTTGLSSTLKSGGGTVAYDVTGSTLTAYVDNGAHTGFQAAEDRQVFTLALNTTTGAYTFTLLDQLDHPVTDNPGTVAVETSFEDNLALNLGSILQATDKDGDKVTAAGNKLVISVNDDSPIAFTPTSASVDNTGTDTDTEALGTTGTIGADAPGTAKFVDTNATDNFLYAANSTTPVTSGGQNIVLSGFGTGTLTGTTATSLQTVFVASLDMTTDQYTITFSRPIDDGSVPTSLLGAAPVRSGNPTYNLIDNVANTDLDLLFSGETNGVQTTVNVSTNGAGTGNQTMNAGEMLRIDFTKDASLAGQPTGSDFVMGTHKNVNDFAFLVSQNTPSGDHSTGTVLIRIFDCNNDKSFTNDTLDTVAKVKYNGTVIYDNGVATPLTDANGNTVTAIGVDTNNDSVVDSVIVTGLNEGKSGDGTGGDDPMITVHAATTYNRVEMTNYAGQTVGGTVLGGTDFDIAPAGVFQGTAGNPVSFSLPVQTADYDGDTSPVELIGVTVQPLPLA